jgi:shikimate dehydrogenase
MLPILAQGPAELVIVNRTVSKAQELAAIAQKHNPGAVPVRGIGYGELQGATFDVVFNATSASLTAQVPPLSIAAFAPGALAYELAYGKGLTPFLKLAQQAGVTRLADGVGMLAEQAAEAFLWWRGVRPDTRAVIDTLTVPLV